MNIENEEHAANALTHVGYYHLSAYFKNFQYIDDNFIESTTFTDIMDLYAFDKRLVLLFFDAIERIEISLRSTLTNVMTQVCGTFWYLQRSIFLDRFDHGEELQFLKERVEKASKKEGFLQHYLGKYDDALPPSWILMEILAFGEVLSLYQSLLRPHRKSIALFYGVDERVLISWLRGLLDIRNICAHHERLWNRRVRTPITPSDPALLALPDDSNKMYSYILITSFLLKRISPTSSWFERISEQLQHHPEFLHSMGCPKDWGTTISKRDAALDTPKL